MHPLHCTFECNCSCFCTFDHEPDRVSVRPVRVLHVQVVPPRVCRPNLAHEEAGDVAVLTLRVLNHLLRKVAAASVLKMNGGKSVVIQRVFSLEA